MTKYTEILEFWNSIGPKGWWIKDDKVDTKITDKFGKTHADASNEKYSSWESEPDSALALVIVLDQFSRNLFRGEAKSFAQDQMALEIAQRAIEQKFDQKVDPALMILDGSRFWKITTTAVSAIPSGHFSRYSGGCIILPDTCSTSG